MIFDENGLPRDNGATDFNDSARLAGIMWLVDHPQKPMLNYYFNVITQEPQRCIYPEYDMSRDQSAILAAGCRKARLDYSYAYPVSYITDWFLNRWFINKDFLSPSVRNHFRLCAGLPGTWLGYQWLKLDIWWNGKFGKIDTEQNQLLAMCLIAGPEWVKRYVNANPIWKVQTRNYWRGWRGEPELAEMLIKKVEELNK